MKRHILFGTLALLAGSLVAANAAPKDDVTAAAKKLADKDNYAWKQKTENAGGGGFGGGTSEGKTEKDGYLWLSMTMRDNTIEAVKKGDKGAIKTADGWQSLGGACSGDAGPAMFIARRMQTLRPRPPRSTNSSARSRNSSRTAKSIPAKSRKMARSRSLCSVAAVVATGLRSAVQEVREVLGQGRRGVQI